MTHKTLTIDFKTPIKTQLEKLGIKNYLDLDKITCLFPHVKTIHNIENGMVTMGKSPENCEREFSKQNRRGVCIHEGLALYRKDTKLLEHRYIDLIGSRYDSGRVPYLDPHDDGPKLDLSNLVGAIALWGAPSTTKVTEVLKEGSTQGLDALVESFVTRQFEALAEEVEEMKEKDEALLNAPELNEVYNQALIEVLSIIRKRTI